jgi:hypothetical protein
MGPEPRERSHLVDLHQPAVSHHIGGQHRGKLVHHVFSRFEDTTRSVRHIPSEFREGSFDRRAKEMGFGLSDAAF